MYCTFLFHKSVMCEVFSFGRFSPLPDELIFEQLRGVNDRMFIDLMVTLLKTLN